MELESPRASWPAILVLGVATTDWPDLDARCHASGILADRAEGLEEALDAFLRRGGHDAALVVGPRGENLEVVLSALRAVDPRMPVWEESSAAELTPARLERLLARSRPLS